MSQPCKSHKMFMVGVQVPTALSRDFLLWMRVGQGISEAAQVWTWDSKFTRRHQFGCWLSQEASHHVSTLLQTSTKTFMCRNCTKMLLPDCFCCSKDLGVCIHVWNQVCKLCLCIWKCTELFLLCSEFLRCFLDKITLSSILVEELYLEGMNAQALPEFQPLLRNSVADELWTWGVNFLPGESQPGCMMVSLAECEPALYHKQGEGRPSL